MLHPQVLFAATITLASVSAMAEDQAMQLTPSMVSQTVGIVNSTRQDPLDPDNHLLKTPKYVLIEDLKPNLKAQFGSSMNAVLRPRFRANYWGWREANVDKTPEFDSKTYWQELFVQWNLSERFAVTWGRQNFQWGAAESLNASNRLVHDLVVSRQAWTETKGKDMVRVNFTPTQNLSLIAAGVVQENKDETPVRAEQEFQQEGFVKAEISWNASADYLGVVVGGRQHDQGWFGAYLNYGIPFWEGLSLYADSSFEHGSRSFYPSAFGPKVAWGQNYLETSKVKGIVVSGLKYDFVDGSILRGEYLSNQFGYSKEQWELRERYFMATPLPELLSNESQLGRSLQPGLDLLRQRYVYVSLYLPNLAWKDFNVSLRTFNSLDEASGSHYLALEYFVTEAGAVLFSESVNSGSKSGEFMRGVAAVHSLGYRHQW